MALSDRPSSKGFAFDPLYITSLGELPFAKKGGGQYGSGYVQPLERSLNKFGDLYNKFQESTSLLPKELQKILAERFSAINEGQKKLIGGLTSLQVGKSFSKTSGSNPNAASDFLSGLGSAEESLTALEADIAEAQKGASGKYASLYAGLETKRKLADMPGILSTRENVLGGTSRIEAENKFL